MPEGIAEDRALLERLHEVLQHCARSGETVSYRDLAQRADFPGPHVIHRLTLLLEDMMREDHAEGRPLLAALAVSRAQGGIPGRGFFQLLADLGRYHGPDSGTEAAACHAGELAAALAFWAEESRPD